VYSEEIRLIGELTGQTLMARPQDLVLWRSGRDYYAAGQKVARVVGGGWAERPTLATCNDGLLRRLQARKMGRPPAWLRREPIETRNLLAEANSAHLAYIEEEAIDFLRNIRAHYHALPLVVSWSGGKDSTVVSSLARRAFPGEGVLHVFADTTNELPCTYDYLDRFRGSDPTVPFLVGYPTRDFLELCREIGPPSRIQKWCCTSQKAAPLANVLRSVADGTSVLVVSGLRRSESARRQSYERVECDTKIGLEILLNPVLEWTDN